MCGAERLREEATVQEQRNIALQAQVMHMQSAAEDNRQLQQDIERLSKVQLFGCTQLHQNLTYKSKSTIISESSQ